MEELISAGELRLTALLDHCRVRELGEAELLADRALAAADPKLLSLLNVNEPADYERALALGAPPA